MGPLPIPPQGLIVAPLIRVLRSARNRVLVAEKQLVNDGSRVIQSTYSWKLPTTFPGDTWWIV